MVKPAKQNIQQQAQASCWSKTPLRRLHQASNATIGM
jgi:hypothetical protein